MTKAFAAPPHMQDYLICYDICCPKRLAKIHRHLRRKAIALQYSVFLLRASTEQLEQCLQELESLMHTGQDDIRAYPLAIRGVRWTIGKPVLPQGILWAGLPSTWQQTGTDSEEETPMPENHEISGVGWNYSSTIDAVSDAC